MVNSFPQLQVFVLTYNRADRLEKMLESLCCQTAQDFKITVLDNASTDNTREVVRSIRKKYPKRNLDVITHKQNLGNLGNFRKSQELASFEYTAVFHDDDVIHPEYLERAMNLFAENEDAVFCSGALQAVFMPENYNWPILGKHYFVYPKGMNAYLQMMIVRSSFQTAIYRTDVYKKTQYRDDLYGKLHDIIFLMEIGEYGDAIMITDICARVGIGVAQDSNDLKTGPYPEEILHIVSRILELMGGEKEAYSKPVLWNFTYFLYEWSCLSRFVTWDEFKEKLQEHGVFSKTEISNFSMKCVMDRINGEMLSWAETYKASCSKYYSGTRSGLIG